MATFATMKLRFAKATQRLSLVHHCANHVLQIRAMVDTILRLKAAYPKIAGFVFGALTTSQEIDSVATKSLVEAAQPHSITFHRAFDRVLGPFVALNQLDDLGIDRILTSGRPGRAIDNLCILRHLVIQSRSTHIKILVGGKVRLDNARELVSATGVTELHSSTSFILSSDAQPTSSSICGSPCCT
jgi:copper homeostasis protein